MDKSADEAARAAAAYCDRAYFHRLSVPARLVMSRRIERVVKAAIRRHGRRQLAFAPQPSAN